MLLRLTKEFLDLLVTLSHTALISATTLTGHYVKYCYSLPSLPISYKGLICLLCFPNQSDHLWLQNCVWKQLQNVIHHFETPNLHNDVRSVCHLNCYFHETPTLPLMQLNQYLSSKNLKCSCTFILTRLRLVQRLSS